MKIHPTAIVSAKANIAEDVVIGAYSIVHDNVVLASGTEIQSYCELGVSNGMSGGDLLNIGKDSLVRSHSVFYEGSVFGDGLITGHRVTVREKTLAGRGLQIGTLSDIQGHCEIGDYVRFHSNVHIGQRSQIGNFVWIFPYVVLTNDPHPPSETLIGAKVRDFAVIATMSVILPGAIVSEGCLIGAHSSLKGETEAGYVYAGAPAKKIFPASQLMLSDGRGAAYPWTRHFKRGYPEEVIERWGRGRDSIS